MEAHSRVPVTLDRPISGSVAEAAAKPSTLDVLSDFESTFSMCSHEGFMTTNYHRTFRNPNDVVFSL